MNKKLVRRYIWFFSFFVIVLLLIGCSDGSKKAYNEALIANSVGAFEKFINDYPESDWVEPAVKHIREIQYKKVTQLTELITQYGNVIEQYRYACWEGKDYPNAEVKDTYSAEAFVDDNKHIVVATKNTFDRRYFGDCGSDSGTQVNNIEYSFKLSEINFCAEINNYGSRTIKLKCKSDKCITYKNSSKPADQTWFFTFYVNGRTGEKSIIDSLASLGVEKKVCD